MAEKKTETMKNNAIKWLYAVPEKKKLYMYMRGDNVPNLTTAYQLSKLLHCDINDFLEGVNE